MRMFRGIVAVVLLAVGIQVAVASLDDDEFAHADPCAIIQNRTTHPDKVTAVCGPGVTGWITVAAQCKAGTFSSSTIVTKRFFLMPTWYNKYASVSCTATKPNVINGWSFWG
jgi:hypothetical protein